MAKQELINGLSKLVEACRDSADNFRAAADVKQYATYRTLFENYAAERFNFAAELQNLIRHFGGRIEEVGHPAAPADQNQAEAQSARSRVSDNNILEMCQHTEGVALQNYEAALQKHWPEPPHAMIQRQYQAFRQAHEKLDSLPEMDSRRSDPLVTEPSDRSQDDLDEDLNIMNLQIDDDLQPDDESKETYDLLISVDHLEIEEGEDADVERDLAMEDIFDTQHGEGHTYNPHLAWDQGLTYTPPTDPPVLPSEDDPQGVEVAAGFALSMEDSNPDVEDLPARVDNNDLDLLDDVYVALRDNSETGHLTHIKVQVNRGVVNLLGTVATEDDIWRVHEVVKSLDGVVAITNNLQVEE